MSTSGRGTSGAQGKIVIERTFKAKVQELWDLWTTKEGFESWWGPEGFRADVHEMDVRVGGKFMYDMVAATEEARAEMRKMGHPESHETRGWFTELKPYERLTITHLIDFMGVTPYEMAIAVEFVVVGDWVRMITSVDAMHSEEFTRMSTEGYTSQLRKLEKRFETR